MAGRIRNRRELRAAADAAEKREEEGKKAKSEEESDEEEDEDEDEDDDGEVVDIADEDLGEDSDSDEDEEEVKPKKKKKAAAKTPRPKRIRTVKQVRQKAVWAIFNNSNQRVAVFDYPKKQDAYDHAAKLKTDSKTNQSYFVQMIKEPME